MNILRQGRWLRSVFPDRGALSFAATAVAGAALLLPGADASAPHSHTRRTLPTALHTSSVADTGPHTSRKAGKAKAGTRSAGASGSSSSAARRGAKHGKGKQPAQSYESPVPMYRARRGGTGIPESGGRASSFLAHTGKHSGFAYGPAPLVSSYGHNGRHGVDTPSHKAIHDSYATSLPAHPSATSGHRPSPDHDVHPAAAAPTPKAEPVVAANRPEVYAEGVSKPEDDERLPRDRAVLGEDAPTPAPVVRISAAPSASASPVSPGAQPQVVQGFGGEIAIPSSPGTDRPGGTRRRNHPSGWQPESLSTQPEPLEEREAITTAAISPTVLPEIYDRNGRLLMPAPLKGSHDVLVHQNFMATSDGLERIVDDADLDRMRASHQLVNFPWSESLRVNEDLPLNRRVARPWTVMFAADMGRAFYEHFRQPLQVNSAARTVHYQARLLMVNGNAAGLSGDTASPHLTGQAIDLAKRGMSQAQLAWMRGYLLPLIHSGKIDVEEEFQQSCFHVSVYRSYAVGRRPAREVAQVHTVAPPVPDSPDDH